MGEETTRAGSARAEADTLAPERTRVDRIYTRYRDSRRKRRAWAADNPGNIEIRRELLDAVLRHARPDLAAGAKVLDMGCGNGFWLAALRDSGVDASRLTGVDVQAERAAAAARLVPGATVVQADVRSLPFEADSFGVILMFTVLSSLANPPDARGALEEAKRVLSPAGLLLIYEPRMPSPLNRRARRISARELDRAGISPRTEERLTVLPPLARRLGRATAAMYPRLARVPALCSHRLVVYR